MHILAASCASRKELSRAGSIKRDSEREIDQAMACVQVYI